MPEKTHDPYKLAGSPPPSYISKPPMEATADIHILSYIPRLCWVCSKNIYTSMHLIPIPYSFGSLSQPRSVFLTNPTHKSQTSGFCSIFNYNHYTTLQYTTPHYTTPQYTQLHYTTLPYPTLHYITLQYITLHHMINHP